MTEFAVRGPLCIRVEGLCGLLQRTDEQNEAYFSATQRKRGLGRSSLTLWETGVTKYIPDAAHLLQILETSLPQTNGLPLEPNDVYRCSREKKSSIVKLLWETCPLCDIHHSIY